MKFTVEQPEVQKFNPITVQITLESIRDLQLLRDALGSVDGSNTFELFTRLDDLLKANK